MVESDLVLVHSYFVIVFMCGFMSATDCIILISFGQFIIM
jgi:hypothetical protein